MIGPVPEAQGLTSPSVPRWPCPSWAPSSRLFLHATTPPPGAGGREGWGGTYLGRPWLGRLAGPGHSKGALGSAGLPGRQAASWTLCGLVTGHQGGQGGRGRGQGPETREMVVRAEGSGWALWPGAWLEPLGGQKESPALDRRRPGEDRRSPPTQHSEIDLEAEAAAAGVPGADRACSPGLRTLPGAQEVPRGRIL